MLQRTEVDLKSGRLTIQRTKGSLSGVYAMQPDKIKALLTSSTPAPTFRL